MSDEPLTTDDHELMDANELAYLRREHKRLRDGIQVVLDYVNRQRRPNGLLRRMLEEALEGEQT
jgi:hypothetical protein